MERTAGPGLITRFWRGAVFTGRGKTCFRAALYQGTTSVVPASPLFLMSRADFTPRGNCLSDFFRSLFQPCRSKGWRRWALAREGNWFTVGSEFISSVLGSTLLLQNRLGYPLTSLHGKMSTPHRASRSCGRARS